ncbi:MAG TPA: cation:proton antiporter [Nitrospirae bacterium]|nr:cation:proton antiporter [Nitrospirota bacterium]
MTEQILIMFTIIGGAAIVPFVGRRFHIPSSVLEILYGVLLFNTVLKEKPQWFLLMKELGIIYLMFIAGMELDIRGLRGQKRILWYVAVPLSSFIITPVVFIYLGFSFYLGIAVSVISAGIIIPILKELNLLDTPIGRDIMGIALVGELLSILVLAFVDIYHGTGLSLTALWEGVKLLGLLALTGLFLRVLYLIAWWNPEKVEKVMESEDPVEEGIRAVVSIAFAGALIAHFSGVEAILGSFLVGVVFSYVFRSKGVFEDKLNAVGFGFFIPFFFIGIGADLNLSVLTDMKMIYLSLLFTLAIFLSNSLPLFVAPLMGFRGMEAFGITLILSAPLSLIVVTGALGVRMGLIPSSIYNSLILTGIVASVLYPTLFRLIHKKFNIHDQDRKKHFSS